MKRAPHFTFWLSLYIGLVLQLVELPDALNLARPLWLPLILGHWALSEPRVPSLLGGLVVGLMLDAVLNTPLGQHALGFTAIVFIIQWLRSIFGLLPTLQAMLVLIPIWVLFVAIMFLMDGIHHHASNQWMRWTPVLSTTMFWPLVHAILGHFAAPRRDQD